MPDSLNIFVLNNLTHKQLSLCGTALLISQLSLSTCNPLDLNCSLASSFKTKYRWSEGHKKHCYKALVLASRQTHCQSHLPFCPEPSNWFLPCFCQEILTLYPSALTTANSSPGAKATCGNQPSNLELPSFYLGPHLSTHPAPAPLRFLQTVHVHKCVCTCTHLHTHPHTPTSNK